MQHYRCTIRLYQAVSLILSAAETMLPQSSDEPIPPNSIDAYTVLPDDITARLTTDKLGELANLHECRRALVDSCPILVIFSRKLLR
ncbi:MAG: hypothetical protein K6U11_12615 [bacterium]|nr:hypothetical protein [bacterium]